MQENAFGNFIKKHRLKHNIKQSTLAKYIDTDQGTISRIENGLQEPSLNQLYLLQKHLHFSLDNFFKTYKKS